MVVDDKKTGLPRKIPLSGLIAESIRLGLIPIFSLPQNQIDALNGSNSPSSTNVFATIADLPTIPTNVSTFTNDAGYITLGDVPTNVSSFTNDAGYITLSDVPPSNNLFTADLTLAANRTHDLNGNSVTFLKSNFEFRAADALTSTIGFRYRNLANNQNIFSIKNQGRVEINGSDALVLLGGTSYTAYWLTTPTAQMSMFNEGLNQVGFRQNTNNLLFQRGGGNVGETHSSITIANGSWNIGLNWAALTANLNIGMTTLDQARLGVQASDGNGANKTIVVRNHLNTGDLFQILNSGRADFIANATASAAEEIIRFQISDSTTQLRVSNGTTADGVFAPSIVSVQNNTNITALGLTGQILDVDDTGTSPINTYIARRTGSAVTTRPLFRWRNFTTNLMDITADGTLAIGTITPNLSALVDITSTTKGFLPPRMTTVQRDAIASPAAGLVVYNSTTNKHQGYNGSTWNDFY
jgi:hypothetical protein